MPFIPCVKFKHLYVWITLLFLLVTSVLYFKNNLVIDTKKIDVKHNTYPLEGGLKLLQTAKLNLLKNRTHVDLDNDNVHDDYSKEAALISFKSTIVKMMKNRTYVDLNKDNVYYEYSTVAALKLLKTTMKPRTLIEISDTPKRWVALSLAVYKTMRMAYAFCLPLVVASWQRVNWNTTVIIVSNINFWNKSPVLSLVRQVAMKIDNNMRFYTMPVQYNPVSYAQVVRLFASSVTPWILPDDIIMTSDVDILPLNRKLYDRVNASGLFILNADCCGSFRWKNESVQMQPMTSIAMTSSNWKLVMEISQLRDNDTLPDYMNSWLQKYHGKRIPTKNVKKGSNSEWYKDQIVISVQIHKSGMRLYKIPRRTSLDRVDRVKIFSWKDFKSHVDAHVFLPSYRGFAWSKTQSLISDIFTLNTTNTLKSFQQEFVKLLYPAKS